MNQNTYQAAKTASVVLENHFKDLIRVAIEKGEQKIASIPKQQNIEAIINVAFWASLRKEEGRSPKISISFLSPEEAEQPLLFGVRLPFNTNTLVKLAPGIERAGVHLGVWEENGSIYIWGTTLTIPDYCFVCDVSEAGLLVIKHRRLYGFGKYTNVAVLKGDEIKIIDKQFGSEKDSPSVVTALLDLNSPCSLNNGVNVLIQLAVSMRKHQHGGILLVVPPNSSEWRKSIVHPLTYPVYPSFGSLAKLMEDYKEETAQIEWRIKLYNEVENIAGLTAVDGAMVISRDFNVYTFGAKISRKDASAVLETILYIEPVDGGEAKERFAGEVGGTRHLSAAQFIYDQRDALAMVASQDGHFTVFSWSEVANKVQAHRIDTLLI
ncbi:putative sensor domain DACNV-containing protein [Pedobacter segetis]|nr:hypothetical protein [Pedobacter segetis]